MVLSWLVSSGIIDYRYRTRRQPMTRSSGRGPLRLEALVVLCTGLGILLGGIAGLLQSQPYLAVATIVLGAALGALALHLQVRPTRDAFLPQSSPIASIASGRQAGDAATSDVNASRKARRRRLVITITIFFLVV